VDVRSISASSINEYLVPVTLMASAIVRNRAFGFRRAISWAIN
jgi:hypothetical protein